MHRFLATFAPGFEGIIESLLKQVLPSAAETRVSSGILFFSWNGPLEEVGKAAFFNNIFLIVQEWNSNTADFPDLVRNAGKTPLLAALSPEIRAMAAPSFRVRYSKENQFCAVDKNVMENAEGHISKVTGLKPDRLNPGIEFWYIIRRENCSFFALCLTKKQSTEKYLRKGELRPEIVQLIVGLSGVSKTDRILLDPFAGYGTIPEQLALVQNDALIYASDIDPDRVADLQQRFSENTRVSVHQGNAASLAFLASSSVDLIVTDPPWGFWEGDVYSGENSINALYAKMLTEFDRILAKPGRAFVLTGAKREFEEEVLKSRSFGGSAAQEGYRTDILVNGKKSAVFALVR